MESNRPTSITLKRMHQSVSSIITSLRRIAADLSMDPSAPPESVQQIQRGFQLISSIKSVDHQAWALIAFADSLDKWTETTVPTREENDVSYTLLSLKQSQITPPNTPDKEDGIIRRSKTSAAQLRLVGAKLHQTCETKTHRRSSRLH